MAALLLRNVLLKNERPQHLRGGRFRKLVDFQFAITGKRRTQIPWMSPTDHRFWQGSRNQDDLNLSVIRLDQHLSCITLEMRCYTNPQNNSLAE